MRKLLVLMALVMLTGCILMPKSTTPSVTIEFRPGSMSPMTGLTEMKVVGSEQTVYISEEVVLSNNDVSVSSVITAPDGPQIEIIFTEVGAKKFTIATENNIMKPLCILIDGLLISAPIIQEKITSKKVLITGSFSDEEARRISDGLTIP